MRYEGDVYRPPSEAYSLIIQLTIGCARNTCTFCNMYKAKKFRIRPLDDVLADMEKCAILYGSQVRRIFLADGDAMIVRTADLLYILEKAFALFPRLERVSLYAAPKDVLAKSGDELRELRNAGLTIAYIGLESGDDVVLENVKKGASSREIIEAGLRLKAAGIAVSITAISGLGSEDRMTQHAIHTAEVINAIKPEYASLLTLMIHPAAPLWHEIQSGAFKLLSQEQIMAETRIFLENIDSEGTVFRSNHASNYVALAGTFNKDIPEMLQQIEAVLASGSFKPERWRRL